MLNAFSRVNEGLRAMAKKKVVKKAAKPAKAAPRAAKKVTKSPRTVAKKKPVPKKTVAKKPAPKKTVVVKPVVTIARKPVPVEEPAQRKKGVRKATISSGVHDDKPARKLGRSRIPIDAPLDVVFQNDLQAREAFMFLGIHSIRDLEQFNPDDLVLRLTGPAKLTVGRIRKILAMNNRCLSNDEEFALEFQELLSRPRD
jgi:hypothetical protein